MIEYSLPVNAFDKQQSLPYADDLLDPDRLGYKYPNVEGMTRSKLFTIAAEIGVLNSYLDSDGYAREVESRANEVNAFSTQWKAQVLNRNAAVTANALTGTVKPVFQALTVLGAGAIDLRDLPAEQVNGVHLAVVLRATFKLRNRTPGWKDALAIARQALARDGLEERDALVGLIK